MRIVVLVKEVPDTYRERRLNLETGLLERDQDDVVLDEVTERALEVALTLADAHAGSEVVLLAMGPESASASVRKGIALGAGSAMQVIDDELLGADLGLTAEALAAAIRRTGYDLVIAGNRSTDGAGGVIPAMVAELLDIPHATNLESVVISAGEVSGTRATDGGTAKVRATLPAIISITEALPDARFANFKGILAAKKVAIETVSLADLGIDALDLAASRSIVIAVRESPPRAVGVTITDEGDAGRQLAEFLVQNRLA